MTDDPVALRSERMFAIFARYLAWRMSRDFHAVRIAADGWPLLAPDRPAILYSNHPSWWDAALNIILAHRLMPGRPGFGPMESEAFERYRIFRRMGVFGIGPDRAGARRFLEVGERVLDLPGGTLWITAEGTFNDARVRPLSLRPGLAHLIRRRPDAVVLPFAVEVGFWNESKPEATLRFGAPVPSGGAATVADLTGRLASALETEMDRLARDNIARDPSRFAVLIRGRAGTDRVYDGWRRARNLLRGQRFDPAHGARR